MLPLWALAASLSCVVLSLPSHFHCPRLLAVCCQGSSRPCVKSDIDDRHLQSRVDRFRDPPVFAAVVMQIRTRPRNSRVRLNSSIVPKRRAARGLVRSSPSAQRNQFRPTLTTPKGCSSLY